VKFGRRQFLFTGSSALLGAASCKTLEHGWPEKYEIDKPPVPGLKGWRDGEERVIRSLCLQCEGCCGIAVRVVEGRAVKIEGNPDYPTNRGGLCPKGLNGLQVLYDPDRIRTPLQRVGPRGAGHWEPISWDDAIARVGHELSGLRSAGKAHTLAFLSGRSRGHMPPMISRFLRSFGSPNDIDHESLCGVSDKVAHELMQGVRDRFAYDWANTNYVLSFGAGLVESFRPTAMMLRVYGEMRSGREGHRTKLVQIDPRHGMSAARADEWLAVRPGTDAALALAMAHVIVRDDLQDDAFVAEHTQGFESWTDAQGRPHKGFREHVLASYAPESVAALTGIEARTIERIAHEFADHQPGVAVAGRGVAAHANGVWNVMAVHALNALAGNLDAPGGVLVQRAPPLKVWAEPELDAVARAGLGKPRLDLGGPAPAPFARSGMAQLAERIERGDPYALGALFVYYTNPLFSSPHPARLRAAIDRVPFIASFSPFLDETTQMADLVLPDHTYLERHQLDVIAPSVGHALFGVRQPVVEPLHQTRSTGQVLIDVARALGGSVAAAFDKDELDLIKEQVSGVQEAQRGSIQEDDADAFWDALLKQGGWWDAPYAHGNWPEVLRTASGKFEFSPTRLVSAVPALADSALGGLPRYEPIAAQADSEGESFALDSYKTMTHAEGRGANQPHLQEIFGVQYDRQWGPWVELHPLDAAGLGVEEGDDVVLEGPAGRARLAAVVEPHAQRGTVYAPFEYGHSGYGRWAAGRGESVNPVVSPGRDALSGSVAWYDARVRVRKA